MSMCFRVLSSAIIARNCKTAIQVSSFSTKVAHPQQLAMPLVLHMLNPSPPSCAVRMLGDILGLEFEFKQPNILHLEHRTPEFKKINPMATIPVLQDDDFTISESHAIMQYLLSKYGGDKREELYPSDPRTRAVIDQCMFFDAGVFFVRLKVVALPTLLEGLTGPTARHVEDIELAYGVVEAYLEGKKYIAANHLTLADLSVGSTALAMQGLHKLDPVKFPRCKAWLDLLEEEPFFKKINTPGATELANILNLMWEKNKNNK